MKKDNASMAELLKKHAEDVRREKKVFPWFTLGTAVFLVIVFVLQFLEWFTDAFLLVPAFLSSKPYTLLTNIFLHGGVAHLVFNLIGLWVFGSALEKVTNKPFMAFTFIFSGLVGSVGAVLLNTDPLVGFLGASGAVFGFVGAVMILRPNLLMYFYGTPVPMKYVGPMYIVLELFAFFRPDNIAHSAHVFGMLGGILAAYLWKDYKDRMKAPLLAGATLGVIVLSLGAGFLLGELQGGVKAEESARIAVLIDTIVGEDPHKCSDLYDDPEVIRWCVQNMALAHSNPEYCDVLKGEEISFCRLKVSLSLRDPGACTEEYYPFCAALIEGKPEECGDDRKCMIVASRSITQCDYLEDERGISACKIVIGLLEEDDSACDSVSTDYRDDCLFSIAMSTKEESTCAKISDDFSRGLCSDIVSKLGG